MGPPAARRRRFGFIIEAPRLPLRRLLEHLLARRRHGDHLGLHQRVDLLCELADLRRLLVDAGLQLGLDGPVGLGQLPQDLHVVWGAGQGCLLIDPSL